MKNKMVGITAAVLSLLVTAGAVFAATIEIASSGSGDYAQQVYIDHDDPVYPLNPNWNADVRESIVISNSASYSTHTWATNWAVSDWAIMTTPATGMGTISSAVEFHDLADARIIGANNFHVLSSSTGAWFQSGVAGQEAIVWNNVVPAGDTFKANTGITINGSGYGSTVRVGISDYPPYPRPSAENTVSNGGWGGAVGGIIDMTTFYGVTNDSVNSSVNFAGYGDGSVTFHADNGNYGTRAAVTASGVADESNFYGRSVINGKGVIDTTVDYTYYAIFLGALMDTVGK
jgi:hypothetical protein